MTELKPQPPPTGRESRSVTLSGRDLDDARRLLGILTTGATSIEEKLARISLEKHPHRHEQLMGRARSIIAARQRRIEIFGPAMFGEPGWEILLRLYLSAGESRQSMSRLAEVTGCSKATALRWMDMLTDQGLISRHPHPTDLRTVFVDLTERGREKIENYLADVGEFID